MGHWQARLVATRDLCHADGTDQGHITWPGVPYNMGQENENDNNKNRRYAVIDGRIRDT
jgi:hypothetical protein